MADLPQAGQFFIYRLKNTVQGYFQICYQAYRDLTGYQGLINSTSYELILQGDLENNETPATLYNRTHKKELHNGKIIHLRSSDVFVFSSQDGLKTYYLDPIGFTQIHNFFCA